MWQQNLMSRAMNIQEIIENFDLIDDWEEKYRYLIELGQNLPKLDDSAYSEKNKVQGCVSQVWLITTSKQIDGKTHLYFAGDSDAHIVKGLIAISLAIFSGQSAEDITKTDPFAIFAEIGLNDHLTPQRSNGLASMVKRIQDDAASHLS